MCVSKEYRTLGCIVGVTSMDRERIQESYVHCSRRGEGMRSPGCETPRVPLISNYDPRVGVFAHILTKHIGAPGSAPHHHIFGVVHDFFLRVAIRSKFLCRIDFDRDILRPLVCGRGDACSTMLRDLPHRKGEVIARSMNTISRSSN